MKKVKVVVTQKPDEPVVEKQVLATAIVNISKAFNALRAGGLNRRAIEVLVHDASRVGKPDVRAVLDSLEQLRKDYL
jgi:multidrug efflux pump subunit AcrA (membrane-fusion protein)